MRALVTKIAGDLRRRRLQVVVVALIVALATGVGTVALELMQESSAPYTQAFERLHGAHLTMLFNRSLVSPDQLVATTRLPEVTASAGPWPAKQLSLEYGTSKVIVVVVARADPGGPLDQLQLTAGRWATGPSEIVLPHSFARLIGVHVGGHMRALSTSARPDLLVVGEVLDINQGDAANFGPQVVWVQPAELPSLLPAGQPADALMLYRFHHAASDAELQQRSREIAAAVPANSIGFTYSYKLVASVYNLTTTLTLTFVLAFAVFALGAAALIVANVVSGAVLTSQRDIGIVKALGFTPRQVVATFVGQMLVPALLGCAVGVPLGILGSRPLVSSSADALGLPAPSGLDLRAPLLAACGGLLIVALAATVPALRAGLLRPIDVISQSATPGRRHRSWIGSLLQWVGVSRPATLGAGEAFARPVRGLLTLFAVIMAVATLIFANGLSATLQRIAENRALFGGADVMVYRFGSYPDTEVMQTLNSQPETKRVVAYSYFQLSVPELSSPVTTVAMRGDSGSLGLPLLAGRWFAGPGEAVGGPAFLQQAHLAVGDSFTASVNGRPITLRLVGEYFDFNNFGRDVRIDWSSYLQAVPDAQPQTYLVDLTRGASAATYGQRVAATSADFLSVNSDAANLATPIFSVLNAVLAAMVAILAVIAVAGVFNTLLLTTYERVRDIATLKALGMTPRQAVGMVVASACVLGVIGGIIGVPVGLWLHHVLLMLMGNAVGLALPSQFTVGVYNPVLLPLLALAGIAVAILGAAIPAWMTARAPVAEVLRAE